MTIPGGARVRLWRGAFWAGITMMAAAAACGDDDPSTPIPAAGSGGSTDAGPPAAAGTQAGGMGGAGSAAGSGGAEPAVDAGGPPPVGACTAGDTRECTLDRLCTGVQTCGDDGAFGECVCGTAGLVGSGIVGARCETDADCAGGATCMQADSDAYLGAGGPAGGYCTFSCAILSEEPYDDDCDSHDPESFCGPFGADDSLICIRSCLSLDPDPGEAKCLNRPDLVCLSPAAGGVEPFNAMRQRGYCKPQCGSDADCPAGRFCHHQAGICTTFQVDAAPAGARCTLDTDCSGRACEDRDTDNVGTCTAPCVLGSLSGCGFARDATSRDVACLQPAVAAGRFSEGAGDVGLCRELCDVAEDCERFADGWVCSALNEGAQEFFGRSGACAPPQP